MLESRHCGPRCRSGEIGRRKGLKIPRAQKAHAGSIPASGTNNTYTTLWLQRSSISTTFGDAIATPKVVTWLQFFAAPRITLASFFLLISVVLSSGAKFLIRSSQQFTEIPTHRRGMGRAA